MKITDGAVVPGRGSLAYQTGNWREQRPVIDMERCKSCGQCVEVCPDAAVQMREEVYVVDYEYCKGCGLCISVCQKAQIEISDELNNKGYYPALFMEEGIEEGPADADRKCTGCALCALTCPDIAIEVFREEKPKKKSEEVDPDEG